MSKKKDDKNLAEEVLRDAGKSEEEVQRTGKLDRADDEVEGLFEKKHRTANSPVHKAVWENTVPLDMFKAHLLNLSEPCQEVMKRCIGVVQAHRAAGTLYDANNKVSVQVIDDLGKAGYWGMLIDAEYGGQAATIRSFMNMLTQMAATACPTTAGLASIHGCIGAVDPVRSFGNNEQKKEILPVLASGTRISGFALTEPGAGSDLTALKTAAVLDGDDYVVNGEKLFISNAIHGRTVGLVCIIDEKPAVLIVDLPDADSENFCLVNYGLHALNHTYNNGLKFTNFRVPKSRLLSSDKGDGLIIAYHGLNRGRVALCANAAGVMRLILRSITPESWGAFRKTYGQSIEKRELVQARIARLAGLVVASDALAAWCASVLDDGYRGELECIVAKIFGSEAQKEAAIEIGMKTHGGRSFLEGHLIGDNIHDYLAPCIYEGEGQMLSMALFKTLAKEHGMSFMLPMGGAMKKLFKGMPMIIALTLLLGGGAFAGAFFLGGCGWLLSLLGAAFAGALGFSAGGGWDFLKGGIQYTLWQLGRRMPASQQSVSGMDRRLKGHVKFAQKMFRKLPLELSAAMIKHQLKLADRQCRINALSSRVQDTITILVTCLYADQLGDEATVAAADVICRDLTRKLKGGHATDGDFKASAKLAEMIVEGKFRQLDDIPATPVMRTYKS